MEKQSAGIFNNAFNSSIFAGGDGLSLCNSAHTFVGLSSTNSNSGTTALSATSIEATRLLMRSFVDETGNLLISRADTLLVPPALEETAWEIVNAQGKLDTGDNNPNFSKGKYKIISWDWLTDSNNHFLIDSRMMKLYLKWFQRIPTEFNKDKDFDTLTLGSFIGNDEKQTGEIAGNTLELELLIAEAEAIANSKNVQDWSISSAITKVRRPETTIPAPAMDECIVRSA